MSDLFVTEKDFTRIDREISGEEVDESRFASSIGADDGGEDPFLNPEVKSICSADHAKKFSKFLGSEKFCHATPPFGDPPFLKGIKGDYTMYLIISPAPSLKKRGDEFFIFVSTMV